MRLEDLPFNIAECALRGKEIYARVVKPALKPEDDWKFVSIDVLSEDYEMDASAVAACERLRLRRPAGQVWLERVGEPAAIRRGWRGPHETPT